jgi:hypothetical protein
MRYPLDLTCYLRKWEALFDCDMLGSLFADLIDQGYHLVAASEPEDTFVAWWSMLRDMPERLSAEQEQLVREILQPGLSAVLREEHAAFLARKSTCIEFRAYHTKHILEFHVLVQGAEKEPLLSAEVDHDYLTDAYEESALQAYERWIDVVKLIYHHLRPFYASTYDSDFWHPEDQTSWEDALYSHIRSLTLINIFGPELVQHYGREYLLATPLWRIDQFDDGAMLLLPEPYRSDYVPCWKQASEHLGIYVEHDRYAAHII